MSQKVGGAVLNRKKKKETATQNKNFSRTNKKTS
jgi:hypothetical protein